VVASAVLSDKFVEQFTNGCGSQGGTQGLKPFDFCSVYGTTEVVP
jgi:hypothetical protein